MRLRSVEDQRSAEGLKTEIEWRSYLLRPQPEEPPRSLDDFRAYTRSWTRCAEEEPSAGFRVWQTEQGPPSHSVPAHVVAKAAGQLGEEAFERVHDRLLAAYFQQNRDISDGETLLDIWRESDLPEAEFVRCNDPGLVEQIIQEHNEAIEYGASGVPAVRADAAVGVLMGAQPQAVYERWLAKLASRDSSEGVEAQTASEADS